MRCGTWFKLQKYQLYFSGGLIIRSLEARSDSDIFVKSHREKKPNRVHPPIITIKSKRCLFTHSYRGSDGTSKWREFPLLHFQILRLSVRSQLVKHSFFQRRNMNARGRSTYVGRGVEGRFFARKSFNLTKACYGRQKERKGDREKEGEQARRPEAALKFKFTTFA